jgi:FkbM family methyltransferase
MTYYDDIRVREDPVENVKSWMWPKSDTETFEIIAHEWLATHRAAYLKYVKQRRVVISAGGNCGMYPRLFSQLFKLVYTFEPDPLNFHCLVNNNQLNNVVKLQAALGDVPDLVAIERIYACNVGMNRVATGVKGVFVPQLRLDDMVFPAVDLIQLDVEEYEMKVLIGAEQTIIKHKPVLAIENATDEIVDYLLNFDYVIIENAGVLDSIFVHTPK